MHWQPPGTDTKTTIVLSAPPQRRKLSWEKGRKRQDPPTYYVNGRQIKTDDRPYNVEHTLLIEMPDGENPDFDLERVSILA